MGTSSHNGPRVMTKPPTCCDRCLGKPSKSLGKVNEPARLRGFWIQARRQDPLFQVLLVAVGMKRFREAIDAIQRQAQRLAHVAYRRARTVGDDLGRDPRTVPAILLIDVLHHLLAAFMLEVDVDVRRLVALPAHEALEEEIVLFRIDGRDAQAEANRRVGRRASALTENVPRTGEPDDVPYGEKECLVTQLLDEDQLAADDLIDLFRNAESVIAAGSFPGQLGQELHRRLTRGTQFLGILVTQLIQSEMATVGQLQTMSQGVRGAAKERSHLCRRFQIAFGVGETQCSQLHDGDAVADRGQHVLQRLPGGNVIMNVVAGDQRQLGFLGERQESSPSPSRRPVPDAARRSDGSGQRRWFGSRSDGQPVLVVMLFACPSTTAASKPSACAAMSST